MTADAGAITPEQAGRLFEAFDSLLWQSCFGQYPVKRDDPDRDRMLGSGCIRANAEAIRLMAELDPEIVIVEDDGGRAVSAKWEGRALP